MHSLISASEVKLLNPNEQAILSKKDDKLLIQKVNPQLYTSWIEGKIEFDNENLEVVMSRLARWYNFEYSFKNEKAKDFHFTGRVNNKVQISSILEMLELTTNVKFELEKNTIVIL